MILRKVGGKRQAIHGGIKAKSKKGKVNRAKPAPEPAAEYGPVTALALGAGQALDALLDGLVYAATAVYEFMGKVFHSIYEWCASVLSWISDQIKVATGKAREAFAYVKNVVSSQNIDWVAAHTFAIKALCAAAAIGVGITGGILVGGTVGGVALAAGASIEVGKMVAIMSSAITGGVLAEACYTFLKAGVNAEQIAVARQQALAAA
ncbi:hypothetical protein EBZ80_25295 [bacterium]|nr:hypothetical protein [Betaproteobacteria bacterium]NDE18236.1 hypothetical protein [bacterium]